MQLQTPTRTTAIAAVLALGLAAQAPADDAPAEDLPPREPPSYLTERVYLRDKIFGARVTRAEDGISPARLSFEHDHQLDVTKIDVNAALGFRLGPPFGVDAGPANIFPLLTVEAAGTLNSGTPNTGYLRFGLDNEVIFSRQRGAGGGILFDELVLDFGAYYQTDLEFDASGYGAQVSLIPVKTRGVHVNARPSFKTGGLNLIGIGTLDYFHSDDPGTTALAADTDYAWLEAKVGIEHVWPATDRSNGFLLGLDGTWATDLNGGAEVFQTKARASVFLDPAQKFSLGLTYVRGETRSNPAFQEKTTLSLNFGF